MIRISNEDRLIIDAPGIKGWVREKTIFSNSVPLVKVRYSFKKDIDPNAFMELLTTKRQLWDEGLALYEDVANDDDWTLYRYVLRPPSCFSGPIYSVEKRMLFEEGGTHYGYYTSVPDDILPLNKSYNRCRTLFGGTVLRREGDEYAYYSLSQMDANVNGFTQSLVMRFIPQRSKEFYEKFKGIIHNL